MHTHKDTRTQTYTTYKVDSDVYMYIHIYVCIHSRIYTFKDTRHRHTQLTLLIVPSVSKYIRKKAVSSGEEPMTYMYTTHTHHA